MPADHPFDDDVWRHRAAAVADWLHRSHSWPVRRGDTEAVLARWLERQRALERAGQLPGDRRAVLDELLGERWPSPAPDSRVWEQHASDLAEWMSRSARLPRRRPDADPDERRLARWLVTQRARLRDGTLTAERIAWLDARLPGWNPRPGSRDDGISESWLVNAYSVRRWRQVAGALPRRRSQDAAERRLAVWVETQRQLTRREALHPARCAWLRQFAPEVLGRPPIVPASPRTQLPRRHA